jgi:hypothetical protein
MLREHMCVGGVVSTESSWWAKDAQGIELCRVCSDCEREKLSRYRPEVLSGYGQGDVDEPIEDLDVEPEQFKWW